MRSFIYTCRRILGDREFAVGAISVYDLLNSVHLERELDQVLDFQDDRKSLRRDMSRIAGDLRKSIDQHP